jgi:hypothetical protein
MTCQNRTTIKNSSVDNNDNDGSSNGRSDDSDESDASATKNYNDPQNNIIKNEMP